VTWLVSLGYEVHFLSTSYIIDEKFEAPVVSAGAKVLRLPNEQAVLDFLGREGHAFELFFLSRVNCGGWFFEACRRSNPGAAIIFNTVDLHHVREEREADRTAEPCSGRGRSESANSTPRASPTSRLSYPIWRKKFWRRQSLALLSPSCRCSARFRPKSKASSIVAVSAL